MIKSCDTRYKGYRFRSRLEARWAVFFFYLSIRFNYEPRDFVLADGTRYLPDFWLSNVYFRHNPDPGFWFEVKGQKQEMDSVKAMGLAQLDDNPVCMATGDYFSGDGNIEHWVYDGLGEFGNGSEPQWWWDDYLIFMQCSSCGKLRCDFVNSDSNNCYSCGADNIHISAWHGHLPENDHPALIAARSARFEFGENGT